MLFLLLPNVPTNQSTEKKCPEFSLLFTIRSNTFGVIPFLDKNERTEWCFHSEGSSFIFRP